MPRPRRPPAEDAALARGGTAAAAPFARALIAWQAQQGRHGLPWQGTRDPYRVWLSEIMLQQTQVTTVLGYYERFLARFPDLPSLAAAPLEDVLSLWAGLGYYARARLLHRCARLVLAEHGGRFPGTAALLANLPGIGASTAAAIAAFCYHERAAILDANVKRVLARRHAIDGDLKAPAVLAPLWEHAQALLPEADAMAPYTQAIMDLGATVCTRSQPRCGQCPVRDGCRAHEQGRAAQLPTRVPARARPERTAHLLVVLHRRAVLLEARPPRGIWGGLLSLPEFTNPTALRRQARALGGGRPAPLAERCHGFTHFTLRFTAHVLALAGTRPAAAPGRRWLPLAQIEAAALPAPILGLLRELRT